MNTSARFRILLAVLSSHNRRTMNLIAEKIKRDDKEYQDSIMEGVAALLVSQVAWGALLAHPTRGNLSGMVGSLKTVFDKFRAGTRKRGVLDSKVHEAWLAWLDKEQKEGTP